MRDHMRFNKGFFGVVLLAALTACGGGSLSSGSGSSSSGNGSSSGTTPPGTPNSIQFISATPPQNIGLRGMGGVTSAILVFEVDDSKGTAVPGVSVTFDLSTTVGGITFNPATGVTDSNGQVSTSVQAGSQHTDLQVCAVIQSPSGIPDACSSNLTISTGIPTQANFSISEDTFNVEAYNFDGNTVTVTARLSDRFQNPVPDNTPVTFTTNGGQIQGQCFTSGGACKVTWTSSNPRPVTDTNDVVGHAHILAYAIGEESFTDKNGNGIFDAADSFSDIGEVFMDAKETGSYIPGEFFYDFNHDGIRNAADGLWEGAICEAGALCGPAGSKAGTAANPVSSTTGIASSHCIVMSTTALVFYYLDTTVSPAAITPIPTTPPFMTLNPNSTYVFTVVDANNNVPAAKTKLALATGSVNATLNADSVPNIGCEASVPVKSNSNPFFGYEFTVTTGASPGVFALQATDPTTQTVISSPPIQF